MMTYKCNKGYKSLYAYVDNDPIHIDKIIAQNIKKSKLKCLHGHELILANGKKNKAHFRHMNECDMYNKEMTEWHLEWQSHFPKTEISFNIINKDQLKNRRADVVLDNCEYNIEFQHSYISLEEINERKKDYELHNRKILWVIDCNDTSLIINYLQDSNRYYIEFISNKWKYLSFIEYEYIFLDKDDKIYIIYPNDVKSNMIDVKCPINKSDFIDYLHTNNPIIHNKDIPLQCNIYIKQQGAGNGKTFGLIQNIESKEFNHYKCFIIVTKQHSAKTIIFDEFKKQIKNNNLKHIKNISYDESNNKKYQITYTNDNTDNICHILIATIDSLMYSLGNIKNYDLNKFESIVNSIIDGYIEDNNINSIICNGQNYKLNKEMCLFIDESQDLSNDYAKAIIKIMRNKYIDSYIVGDKLQSIGIINNAFNYFQNNEFSYINKKIYEKTNICRRFYHKDLVKFINTIVPFSKYSLPEIIPFEDDDEINNNHIVIFKGNVYNFDDDDKINIEVEKIMKLYKIEVEENNYNPNDFLIITPFTKKNPLVNAVELAIETYWVKKLKDTDEFIRYAVFHRSEEGTSINLTESENATRIVSIHTSKGDGRNIVFLIGLNESSLLRFSNEKDNLIYDSMIHVALTRMKKKLYIKIDDNGDDISQKIKKYIYDNDITTDCIPYININNKIKYNNIIENLKLNEIFEKIQKEIINNTQYIIMPFEKDDKKIVDMSHHNTRYASMEIFFYTNIIINENTINDISIKKQIQAIFNNISTSYLNKLENITEYNKYLKKKELCVLKISKKGRDFIKHYETICDFITNVKTKIKNILLNNKKHMLCPLESVIIYYIKEVIDQGIYSDITINELYYIIDIYSKSFNNQKGHENCICKNHFNNVNIINIKNIECDKMNKYLYNHYENINNLGKIYEKFLLKYPTVNWLINHHIIYNGVNNDFQISKQFKLIGYDKDSVYIIYLKPQFNELNYNDVLINSIYDTYLIKNIKIDDNNNKSKEDAIKFKNKKIYTVVFSLNNDIYHIFKWYNNENEDIIDKSKDFLKNQLKDKLISKYIIESKYIIHYYKYWKSKYIDCRADIIIKNIIKEFKKNKKINELPHFILKFFERIEYEMMFNKNNNEILEKYDNKEYFVDRLNEVIIDSIEDFFRI